jgi:hypothetical protein
LANWTTLLLRQPTSNATLVEDVGAVQDRTRVVATYVNQADGALQLPRVRGVHGKALLTLLYEVVYPINALSPMIRHEQLHNYLAAVLAGRHCHCIIAFKHVGVH